MNGYPFLAAALAIGFAILYLLHRLEKPRLTQEEKAYIASDAFLRSYEWRQARYKALEENDGRCELCGRNKHQLEPGEYLNVDHVKPRRSHPELALNVSNLSVLCGSCNHGKGNTAKDWRHPGHPHRVRYGSGLGRGKTHEKR